MCCNLVSQNGLTAHLRCTQSALQTYTIIISSRKCQLHTVCNLVGTVCPLNCRCYSRSMHSAALAIALIIVLYVRLLSSVVSFGCFCTEHTLLCRAAYVLGCALLPFLPLHRFAGFIEFESSTRADSAAVVAELRSSGHIAVAMVTGDSVLTAAHVAREVGILGDSPKAQQVEVASDKLSSKKLKRVKRGAPLLLRVNNDNKLKWVPVWDDVYDSNSSSAGINSITATATTVTASNTTANASTAAAAESKTLPTSSIRSKSSKRSSCTSSGSASATTSNKLPRPFRAADIERLSRRHDLCLTGDALEAALQCEPELVKAQLHAVRIFARMTPAQKETVATAIKVSSYCCSAVTVHACGVGTAVAVATDAIAVATDAIAAAIAAS
eukprot:18143-Heterococcus_DN1.PRE.4